MYVYVRVQKHLTRFGVILEWIKNYFLHSLLLCIYIIHMLDYTKLILSQKIYGDCETPILERIDLQITAILLLNGRCRWDNKMGEHYDPAGQQAFFCLPILILVFYTVGTHSISIIYTYIFFNCR